MKKIFYNIILVASLGVVSSCNNDLLDNFTPGAQTEDVAVTKSDDLKSLMNSSLAILSDRTETVFNSVFTDEIGIGFANGGQGINTDFVFFQAPTSTGPSAIWINSYAALSRLNRVIVFADEIVPKDNDDVKVIARLKAEALTVRALLHLKLLAYYTTDMKDNNALSAMKADKVFISTETDNARITNGEMYAFIHSDLNAALTIYNSVNPPANPAGSETYYASKNLAKFLHARAYAYKGDYVNAELWADDVINTSGIALATPANYSSVFWTDSEPANTEVVFRLRRTLNQNSQGTNLGNGYASVTSTANGSPFYEIGRALFNKIPTNDSRYATIVHSSSVINPNYATVDDYRNADKLIIGKNRGNASRGVLNVDYKLARLSEMHLIKAEARVAAGDLAGAGTALKILLDKRFAAAQATPIFANPAAAWAYILNQRRIEFAFEAFRFIDLKRLKDLAGVGIDRDAADYSSNSYNFPGANPTNFPNNSHKWALPIPQAELIVNKAIVSQQNPGY
ncbi:SusD family protein [compost metagenome]